MIYGRDEHMHLPPASLTKLMTAAVATGPGGTPKMITAHVDGAKLLQRTGSTIMGLKPGMELSLLDLLYGLLLPSGNDAAIAIAEGIGGTQAGFVEHDEREGRSRSRSTTRTSRTRTASTTTSFTQVRTTWPCSRATSCRTSTLRQIVSTHLVPAEVGRPAGMER